MAKQVELGLGFDISAFRKGTNDAAKLVKSGLNQNTLKPFDTALVKTGSSIKRNISSNIAGIKSSLIGLKGIIGGVIAAIGIYRITSFLKSSVQEARNLSDAMQKVAGASNAFRTNLDKIEIDRFAGVLSGYSGKSKTDILDVQAKFGDLGVSEEVQRTLARLALDVSAGKGIGIDSAAELIRNVRLGKAGDIEKLGLNPTGNLEADARSGLTRLNDLYGGQANEIANELDKLNATVTNMKASVGGVLVEQLDPMLRTLRSDLEGYIGSGQFQVDMENISAGIMVLAKWGSKAFEAAKHQRNANSLAKNIMEYGYFNAGATLSTSASGLAEMMGFDEIAAKLEEDAAMAKRKMTDQEKDMLAIFRAQSGGGETNRQRGERIIAERTAEAKANIELFDANAIMAGVDYKAEANKDTSKKTEGGDGYFDRLAKSGIAYSESHYNSWALQAMQHNSFRDRAALEAEYMRQHPHTARTLMLNRKPSPSNINPFLMTVKLISTVQDKMAKV